MKNLPVSGGVGFPSGSLLPSGLPSGPVGVTTLPSGPFSGLPSGPLGTTGGPGGTTGVPGTAGGDSKKEDSNIQIIQWFLIEFFEFKISQTCKIVYSKLSLILKQKPS